MGQEHEYVKYFAKNLMGRAAIGVGYDEKSKIIHFV
jgi:hypothetical protein